MKMHLDDAEFGESLQPVERFKAIMDKRKARDEACAQLCLWEHHMYM